jgi:hypothetical protein
MYRTENRSVYFTFCNSTYYLPQQIEHQLQLQLQRHRASHRALLCHLHSTTDSQCFNLQNGECLAANETGKLNIPKLASLFDSLTAALANGVTVGTLVHTAGPEGAHQNIGMGRYTYIFNPLKSEERKNEEGDHTDLSKS